MNLRLQFSARQLMVVVTVYAALFAGIAWLPKWLIAIAAAVTTVFVAIDLGFGVTASENEKVPRWRLAALFTAHYLTALAYAMAICAVVFCWTPSPPSQSVGTFLDELNELFHEIGVLASCVNGSVVLSTLGGLVALAAARHFRWGVYLLIANAPGMLLVAYAVARMGMERMGWTT